MPAHRAFGRIAGHGNRVLQTIAGQWLRRSRQDSHLDITADGYFGDSVSTSGDVNGDGYSDVIVGMRWYTNVQYLEGGTFVYNGSAAGLSPTADWTAESNQAGARFGSVSTAGDVNGDGYSDVIVGADWYDNGQTAEGRVFVYHGSACGLSAPDSDGDCISDYIDNCPYHPNPDQTDTDGDGLGDLCDTGSDLADSYTDYSGVQGQ
ncbi:MAG: integrin alpha, partial [Planctomycetota bacterium]